MRQRLFFCASILLAACFAVPALAGPNAGGVLLIHTTGEIIWCIDYETYCGESDLVACEQAVTNAPGDTQQTIWWITASFDEAASPRLAGITFGVDYNPNEVFIIGFGGCGDFELPTGAWPAPGEGNAVTWSVAETGVLTDVYWFGGYHYYTDDTQMCLIEHPTQGGDFADDDIPANLDPIADYGCLGFGTNPGYLPCPDGQVGSCCFPNGECVILYESDCLALGGDWYGDMTTSCDPNPCPPPALGACCFADHSCVVLTQEDCEALQGEYRGDEIPCEPNPCLPTPSIETTWGTIKSHYR